MTGIERIRSAVAHRESDMVPYDPYVSPGHALHLIKEGPAEKVYEACIRCCEAAAEGGGYILSTEQITPDTPQEHVLAMEEARRDFKL